MAKFEIKPEKKETTVTTKPVEETVRLTRAMLGTYKDNETGELMLAHVLFDPATGQIGKIKRERVAGDYEEMLERLRIRQVQLGLMDPAEEAKSEAEEGN